MNISSVARLRLTAIGWAAFVACSWTWCIGMYLPVLMVRDYGPAAWLVFLTPNIVGAAALGWVLHKRGTAERLTRAHLPAAASFSVVTILFHAFFCGWIIFAMAGWLGAIATVACVAAILLLATRQGAQLILAAIILCVSAALLVAAASSSTRAFEAPVGIRAGLGLLWLAPICLVGFALNPYLDLTFLRARAATEPMAGIAAFTLGFAVLFPVMILFTLWYSTIAQPAEVDHLPRMLAWMLAAHLIIQSAFTVAMHARSLNEHGYFKSPPASAALWISAVASVAIGRIVSPYTILGQSGGEFFYWLFMAFYSLIFPAYVWICMLPTDGTMVAPDRWKLKVWGLAILILLPIFVLGFFGDARFLLALGIGAVLLARLAVTRKRKGARVAVSSASREQVRVR